MNIIRKWLYNSRSFAAPQNIMPSMLAVVMAVGVEGFNLWLGLLAMIGVCLVHLGGNLLDDYCDYKDELLDYRLQLRKEGEKAFTDKYPYLKDGSTTLRQLAGAIAVFFALALVCGLIIFFVRGWDWTLALIAALAAFLCFYICRPNREHSSVGLEHLPYKQRVIGSNPIVPTKIALQWCSAIFVGYPYNLRKAAARVSSKSERSQRPLQRSRWRMWPSGA